MRSRNRGEGEEKRGKRGGGGRGKKGREGMKKGMKEEEEPLPSTLGKFPMWNWCWELNQPP